MKILKNKLKIGIRYGTGFENNEESKNRIEALIDDNIL